MTTQKSVQLQGASPPNPPTRSSAPGLRWGHSPQTLGIGSRSALAIWPPISTPGYARGIIGYNNGIKREILYSDCYLENFSEQIQIREVQLASQRYVDRLQNCYNEQVQTAF